MNNLFRIFIVCTLLLVVAHSALGAEPSLFSLQLSKAQTIRGLKIPLGTENNARPTASVFFGVISIESKRAGFFRIGPIPQPVVTGMRVEISEAPGGTGWAADFARFAAGDASFDRMEIRGIEFRSSGNSPVSVRAGEAQFVASKRALCLQRVELSMEGLGVRKFAAGEVHLEGVKAGQMEWQEAGVTRTISLNGLPSTSGGGVRLVTH